jgi:hypothetical protein
MPVLNPDHLLEQADRLIAPAAGGAPRQADLRRAISTAYYALFHTILTEVADMFAGRTQRHTPRYALVYRSIDHKVLRELCEHLVKSTPPQRYASHVPRGGFGPDLVAVANAVLDLQEKRHLADYDPLFRARTLDTTLAISTARAAVLRFRAATRAQRTAFLSLLAFPPRGSA